jgi:hypothetical protein
MLGRSQRAFDRIVVSHRDYVERGLMRRMIDKLFGRRPSVACGRVHVEVGPTS